MGQPREDRDAKGAQCEDMRQTWHFLHEDIHALVADRRSLLQHGAIDAQNIRQCRGWFARASEYLGQLCDDFQTGIDELKRTVDEDRQQCQTASDSSSGGAA